MTTEIAPKAIACPKCEADMREAIVKSTIWIGERLHVVEDIPAQFCDECMEQFYDEDVTDAVRRLTERGFPVEEAKTEITVPIFSIAGKIMRRKPPVDGEFISSDF